MGDAVVIANRVPGKPFEKGDARIHKGGRTRTFDEVRNLAVLIANSKAEDASGNPFLMRGRAMTRIEVILLDWFTSSDFKKQEKAVAYAFGAPPTQVQLSGKDGEPLSPLLLLLQELRGVAAGQLEAGEPAVDGEVRLLEAPADLDASDPSI
jgi:hypothetical protein